MTQLEAAVLDVASFLESRNLPYMVFGGFSNLIWGRPRLTEDVDFKIILPDGNFEDLVRAAASSFTVLGSDPLSLLRESRVLPISTAGGVRVDLVVAGIPYEEEAVRRAVPIVIAGKAVRICRAEDLVLHKILSDRPRDLEDVEGVIIRQAVSMDRVYLDPRIRDLAAGLERPSILDFYQECLRKAGLARAT